MKSCRGRWGFQDDEDIVIEDLEDEFDAVEVVEDDVVLVEGLEDDFDVVEVVEDGFDEVDVVQDEIVVVKVLEDDVMMQTCKMKCQKQGVKYKLASMYSTMSWWSISTFKMRRCCSAMYT